MLFQAFVVYRGIKIALYLKVREKMGRRDQTHRLFGRASPNEAL